MAAWKMKEANDTWEAVCERAYSDEPQYVVRHGVPSVVVISLAQYEAQVQRKSPSPQHPKNDFSCFFGKTNLKGNPVMAQRAMRDDW